MSMIDAVPYEVFAIHHSVTTTYVYAFLYLNLIHWCTVAE